MKSVKRRWLQVFLILAAILVSGCGGGGGSTASTVTYDGNGNTGGSVPTDPTQYVTGQTVTVLGNPGNLAKTGYSFLGWNTQADGLGTGYTAGSTFTAASTDTVLYAAWAANPAHVVISQLYAAGGATGATYTNDFIELFNPTGAAVSTAGWSIQYASASGTFSTVVILPATSIAGGGYFLIQVNGGATGSALPPADATGSMSLASTGGKVALVSDSTLLPCGASLNSCTAASIVDLVGYGSSVSEYEGTGSAAYPNDSTQSVLRKNGGCVDTDNNDVDFAAGTVAPQNSAVSAVCF